MNRIIAVVVALLCVAPCGAAFADGCMMVREDAWLKWRERALINEPEQKAVIFFSKGKEQLVISPSFEGPTSDFAWVVPVPARPKVEILKGALFHELARLTMPVPRSEPAAKSRAVFMDGAADEVEVLERKTVGAYDVSVLSVKDDQALMKWLKANKYHLPAQAAKPMQDYIRRGWTFVACRVKAPEQAKGLRTGTLAPLHFTFSTSTPVYPLMLSAANPKPFALSAYLIVPADEIDKNKSTVSLVSPCRIETRIHTYLKATVDAGQKEYPTLAKLSNKKLQVYMVSAGWRGKIEPGFCTNDLFFDIGRASASRAKVTVAEVK